ncbi:MAG: hypothetical protein ACYTG6_09560 [Planctomycetota bacterium]
MTEAEWDAEIEAAKRERDAALAAVKAAGGTRTPFMSTHFPDEDILVHVRFNERGDTLFIEEVQSDWHQPPAAERRKEVKRIAKERGISDREAARLVPKTWGYRTNRYDPSRWYVFDTRDVDGVVADYETAEDALRHINNTSKLFLDYAQGRELNERSGGPPDAPFKDVWPTLALKRMIRWAAEAGFTKLGWTTGVQQVERYESALRQKVDAIGWTTDVHGKLVIAESTKTTMRFRVNERGVIESASQDRNDITSDVGGKTIEDLVGKSIAEQILSENSGELAGPNLTIGGKFYELLYDNILVQAANKLGKRFGARVEEEALQTKTPPKEDRFHIVDPSGRVVDRVQTRTIAEGQTAGMEGYQILDTGALPGMQEPIHTLPITPALADKAMSEGFTMWSRTPVQRATTGMSTATKFFKRFFTSAGLMPDEAFESLVMRDAWVRMHMQRTEGLRADLEDARADESWESIDEALRDPVKRNALRPPLRDAVQAMRNHVKELSQHLIDSGAVQGDLAATIDANLEVYLHRSYRVFDDPGWAKKVPEEIRNKAAALVRKEYPEWGEARVQNYIDGLLYNDKAADTPIAVLARGAKAGSKDLTILKRRKEIPEEIRRLFGEYLDPRVNYTRSIQKMAFLIANHRFLNEVRKQGMGKWLFKKEDAPEGNYAEIATPEFRVQTDPKTGKRKAVRSTSKVMAPLNGLVTTPEIKDAFERAVERQPVQEWLQLWMTVNGMAKYSKTVLSVMTEVRNFFGNIPFAMAQGHFDARHLGAGLKAWAVMFNKMSTAEKRAYVERGIEMGVAHEAVRAGEINDVMRDIEIQDYSLTDPASWKGRGKRVLDFFTKMYRAGDDFWKFYAWEIEKGRERKIDPKASEADIEKRAAETIRNTYPTYSLVPEAIKMVRRFPVMGTFVSFPAEVIRTTGKTMMLAHKQLRSKNAAERRIGAQRLVGMTMAASFSHGMALTARALWGMNADDDEAAREFLPPWSKNSDILWLGQNEDGTRDYVDISYTDPYSYIKNPLMALWRGENPQEALVGAGAELLDPFVGEEIATQHVIDIMRNRKESGGSVYNEADSPLDRMVDSTMHFYDAMEPGTISSLRRVGAGLRGRVTLYGKAYDPTVEALAMTTGVRRSRLDLPQAVGFKASEYQRGMSKATSILSSVAGRRGEVSEEEIRKAYERMERSRRKQFRAILKAIHAARALGIPESELRAALDSRMSRKATIEAMRGRYTPYKPSGSFLKTRLEDPRARNERLRLIRRLGRESMATARAAAN